jgi:hypothetical protein
VRYLITLKIITYFYLPRFHIKLISDINSLYVGLMPSLWARNKETSTQCYTNIFLSHNYSKAEPNSKRDVYNFTSLFNDALSSTKYRPTACCEADHRARAVWGMKFLSPLKHWDREVESLSRHGCLSAFLLCLCYHV